MLRYDGKVRLTRKERAAVEGLIGTANVPTDIDRYNRMLDRASESWNDGSPEGRLLAAIIDQMKAPGA